MVSVSPSSVSVTSEAASLSVLSSAAVLSVLSSAAVLDVSLAVLDVLSLAGVLLDSVVVDWQPAKESTVADATRAANNLFFIGFFLPKMVFTFSALRKS
jgi:hypothetical protein